MISTISSDAVSAHMVSTISSDTVSAHMVSTISSDAVSAHMVSTISSDTVCTHVISTVSSDTIGTDMFRTVFSNHLCVQCLVAIDGGKGEGAGSQNREDQAEDQFRSFHGGCSKSNESLLTRYGDNATPLGFIKKSMRVVLIIVEIDSWEKTPDTV